ncbi:MAG: DMT family transporter [Planctomycetes bacterium]|nr:DMT family transporter [Planctomycetota bacterium]
MASSRGDRRVRMRAAVLVLVAGALFGASNPLAKLLLDEDFPAVAMAGTFYLASGVELLVLRWILRAARRRSEPGLGRTDFKWLAGAILAGGIAAPVAQLYGLKVAPAHIASLIVSVEVVFTILIAVLLFGERPTAREYGAMGVVVLGALAVGFGTRGSGGGGEAVAGALLIVLACLLWGFDNNFSERISAKDPIQIAGVKGLVAGGANLVLAAAFFTLPRLDPALLAFASIVGLLSYGTSIALFVYGLRHLGPSRTASLFATAPVWGVVLSWTALGEKPGPFALAGGVILLGGIWALLALSSGRR